MSSDSHVYEPFEYYHFRNQNFEMQKHLTQFQSVKITQNILWTEPEGNENTFSHHPDLPRKTLPSKEKKDNQSTKSKPDEQIIDLEDIWNAVENQKDLKPVTKNQIMNICDEPCTLTAEEYEEIFGSPQKPEEQNSKTSAQAVVAVAEQTEDFGELWDELDEVDLTRKEELKDSSFEIKQKKKGEIDLPKAASSRSLQKLEIFEKQTDFFQIEEKDSEGQGRICLTLGKNFHIFDLCSFLTNCFQGNIYSYFGFCESKPNIYKFYDLTTNQPLMSCSLEKYEQYGEKTEGRQNITFSTDYCLKMRLKEGGEAIGTVWQKSTSNGILYNLKHYNSYEGQHEDSLALIQISDGYIGNNCYCNTTAYLSQKHSTQHGPLKMKLSLKNGYLIAHMGVSGIKSAPYNCRLENSKDSFLYLLGMIEKDQRFLVRLGSGMSPIVAFAISIGRKRYIDSFKD